MKNRYRMTLINIIRNYILIKTDTKAFGFEVSTLRHEVEGSSLSLYLWDNEEYEKPVLTTNINDTFVNDVQATPENINELLDAFYNSDSPDTFVSAFELFEDTDLLKLTQNDGSFFNVYLTKYNTDSKLADIVADLNEEIQRATEKETDIQNALDNYISTANERFVADETLITETKESIEAETNRATVKEDDLQSQLNVVKEDVNDIIEKIDTADSDIDDLFADVTEIKESIETVKSDLTNEITRAEAQETILQNNIDNLAGSLGSESTKLDTLTDKVTQEIIDRIAGDSTVQNNLNIVANDLDNEVVRAETAEGVLDDKIKDISDKGVISEAKIDNEILRATEKESELQLATSQEITRAVHLEDTLDTKIQLLQQNIGKVEVLTDKVNEEKSDRLIQYNNLNNAINNVDTKVNTETTNRISADTIHDTKISALETGLTKEITDRSIEYNNLTNSIGDVDTKVNIEIENRINADTIHDTKISALETGLTNEVTDRNIQYNDLNSFINGVNAKIDTETENRLLSETFINQLVANEKSDRLTAEGTINTKITVLETNLNNEIIDRNIEYNNLSNSIQNIEDLLANDTTDVSQIVSNLENNVSYLQNSLANETTNRINADSGLTASINALDTKKQNKLVQGTNVVLTDLPDDTTRVDVQAKDLYNIVERLPDTGDANVIYLLPITTAKNKTANSNSYEEYIWVEGAWEDLGVFSQTVDLSAYYTQTQTDNMLNTIKGYTVNGTALSGSPITLNGNNLDLTNYRKPTSSSSIEVTDTVNQGLGKLEYKVDNVIGSDVTLTNYVKGITKTDIADTDTVNEAFGKIENRLVGDSITLTNFVKGTSKEDILPTDTVNVAFGKVENQIPVIVVLTEQEYEQLPVKVATTIYLVKE